MSRALDFSFLCFASMRAPHTGDMDDDGLRQTLPIWRRRIRVCSTPKGRNRYRDSPLRGGASLTALRLGRASIAGRAEPSITVAAARSSSTVQHELRCFSRSQRSPAFTCREVMCALSTRPAMASLA